VGSLARAADRTAAASAPLNSVVPEATQTCGHDPRRSFGFDLLATGGAEPSSLPLVRQQIGNGSCECEMIVHGDESSRLFVDDPLEQRVDLAADHRTCGGGSETRGLASGTVAGRQAYDVRRGIPERKLVRGRGLLDDCGDPKSGRLLQASLEVTTIDLTLEDGDEDEILDRGLGTDGGDG
jgi:hypothetical protein